MVVVDEVHLLSFLERSTPQGANLGLGITRVPESDNSREFLFSDT